MNGGTMIPIRFTLFMAVSLMVLLELWYELITVFKWAFPA